MQTSIFSFESLFLYWKQEKVMKAFLFNILLLDYDRHEGFLQPNKKLIMFGWYSRTAVCELCSYVSETCEKAMKYFKNKWIFLGEIINNMLHASLSV